MNEPEHMHFAKVKNCHKGYSWTHVWILAKLFFLILARFSKVEWNKKHQEKIIVMFNYTGSLRQFNGLYLSQGTISSHSWPSVTHERQSPFHFLNTRVDKQILNIETSIINCAFSKSFARHKFPKPRRRMLQIMLSLWHQKNTDCCMWPPSMCMKIPHSSIT